jgi:hypothetical protein
VGKRPVSVAAGFLDRRFLDLVVANAGSNDLSVLSGNGDGTFAPEMRLAAGKHPQAVVVGHLTADPYEDLVAVNAGSDDLFVWVGTGNGTFKPPVRYAVGHRPEALSMAFVNEDFSRDLLVANAGSDDISVLLNASDHFAAEQRFAVGKHPHAVRSLFEFPSSTFNIIAANAGSDDLSQLRGRPVDLDFDGFAVTCDNCPEVSNDQTDTDGDGLCDAADACPHSDSRPTVVIDTCDAGVANRPAGDGCTLADLLVSCADGKQPKDPDHCVDQAAKHLEKEGEISKQERRAIRECLKRH